MPLESGTGDGDCCFGDDAFHIANHHCSSAERNGDGPGMEPLTIFLLLLWSYIPSQEAFEQLYACPNQRRGNGTKVTKICKCQKYILTGAFLGKCTPCVTKESKLFTILELGLMGHLLRESHSRRERAINMKSMPVSPPYHKV